MPWTDVHSPTNCAPRGRMFAQERTVSRVAAVPFRCSVSAQYLALPAMLCVVGEDVGHESLSGNGKALQILCTFS